MKCIVQMEFDRGLASNNMVEYEGLLVVLRAAAGLRISRVVVCGDSQLVIKLVTKEYNCPLMQAYIDEVHKLERRFGEIQLEHIPRG